MEEEKEVEWLDSSKVSSFQLCPRKYAYRYEEHLVPLGGEESHSSALAFGLAIHKALETFYDNSAFERVHCVCGMRGDEAQMVCPYHTPDGTTPRIIYIFLYNYPTDPPEDSKDTRTRWNGAMLLRAYLQKWARESFSVEAIEVPFEIPFYHPDGTIAFKYIGRIDLLIRDTDGKLKPWDHKTAKWFGDHWLEQFKLSFQQTGYMKATSLITSEEVTSGWVNGLKVPLKTKAPDDDNFIRLETSRVPEDFDLWDRELRDYHARIGEYRKEGFWPRSAPFACHAYNTRCAYYTLCTTHGDLRDNIKANSFEKKPWNPQEAD